MDNIKKFEDFLDRLQGLLDSAKKQGHILVRVEDLENTFPELRESEDKKIRGAIIDHLKDYGLTEWAAWLEKQGEQKVPVLDFKAKDWYVSKVDGKIHNIYHSVDKVEPKFKVGDKIIEKDFDECGCGTIIDIKDGKYIFDNGGFINIEEQGLWQLAEQNPAWSEEDEDIRDTIIRDLKRLGGDIVNVKPAYKEEVDWLKSLKRRIGWKPSEEQMKALHDLNLTGNISYAGQGQVLIELYNDLEELIK